MLDLTLDPICRVDSGLVSVRMLARGQAHVRRSCLCVWPQLGRALARAAHPAQPIMRVSN